MIAASGPQELKPLVLDSSHLGQLVKDVNSRRADERRRASEFEGFLDGEGWICAFSYHHIAEIQAHADPTVRAERLDYVRSLPLVAYVRGNGGAEAGFGSIVDVLATEVAAALATDSDDPAAIAAAARPNVFSHAPRAAVMEPLDAAAPLLGEIMRTQAERARRIVAVGQADIEKAPDVTLTELLRLPLRSVEDQEAFLGRLGLTMLREVTERGDMRIDDPAKVAGDFTASVGEAIRQGRRSGVHPILWLLGRMGLRREDVTDDTTIGDLQRIAFHRHRASIAVRGTGIDPKAVAERVRADRLPSAVIGDAMARFGQQPRRRKGSVMNDVYLASLSPYARATSVDKGTFGNVGRASARCPAFKSVIGSVTRSPAYSDLVRTLGRP